MIVREIQNIDKARPRQADITAKIYKDQQMRTLKDYSDFRDALEAAEDVYRPDRFDLIGNYKDYDLDCHVTGVKRAILNKIKSRPFDLFKNNEVDEDATKLLKAEWFFDFLDIVMDSYFYGYSLIQFGSVKNDAFTEVISVDREYIIPEWKELKRMQV